MIREGDAEVIFPMPKQAGGSLSTPSARDACAALEQKRAICQYFRFNKVYLVLIDVSPLLPWISHSTYMSMYFYLL